MISSVCSNQTYIDQVIKTNVVREGQILFYVSRDDALRGRQYW